MSDKEIIQTFIDLQESHLALQKQVLELVNIVDRLMTKLGEYK